MNTHHLVVESITLFSQYLYCKLVSINDVTTCVCVRAQFYVIPSIDIVCCAYCIVVRQASCLDDTIQSNNYW